VKALKRAIQLEDRMTFLIHGLTMLGLLTSPELSQTSNPEQAQRTLAVHIVNGAHVPADVLADARQQVQRIFLQVGVQIVWRQDGEEDQASQKELELTVVITPECFSRATCPERSVTGFAMGSEGRGVPRAYIFSNIVYEKALKFAKRMPVRNPEGLVMGCAIAHEVGHLLLPPGHTKTGVMAPEVDMRSISDALRGDLLFTPKESELIRAVLLSHGRETP